MHEAPESLSYLIALLFELEEGCLRLRNICVDGIDGAEYSSISLAIIAVDKCYIIKKCLTTYRHGELSKTEGSLSARSRGVVNCHDYRLGP
jgi:hypothetical protein